MKAICMRNNLFIVFAIFIYNSLCYVPESLTRSVDLARIMVGYGLQDGGLNFGIEAWYDLQA